GTGRQSTPSHIPTAPFPPPLLHLISAHNNRAKSGSIVLCITRDFRTEAKREGPALLPGGRHRASLRIHLMWIRQEHPANDVPPGGCAGPRLAMVIEGR